MPSENDQPSLERQRTDGSLRVEREKADQALAEQHTDVEETADEVIGTARARAAAVLAEDQVLQDVAPLSTAREHTDQDLESERARSDDALATRDMVLSIVSHDLQSMLHTMVASAELIASEASQENPMLQVLLHVKRIERAGTRMSRLIGDLIDVASIESGRLALTRTPGDPAPVAREAVDALQAQASASGISLVAEIVPLPPGAAFDPARILQVLVNLLSNAIKFTPPHGKVVVHVERVGNDIRFAVSDTGVGIPPDKLDAVFERSFQVARNDRRGIGLGLYISKCIVQRHGGRIWAESTIGEGSTFSFTLPIDGAP
jgi:signal transduction histidine kinase